MYKPVQHTTPNIGKILTYYQKHFLQKKTIHFKF